MGALGGYWEHLRGATGSSGSTGRGELGRLGELVGLGALPDALVPAAAGEEAFWGGSC